MNVKVLYGPNCQEIEVPETSSPQSIMSDNFIANLIGYQPSPGNVVLINGTKAEWATTLNANDEVEILKRAGNKAAKNDSPLPKPSVKVSSGKPGTFNVVIGREEGKGKSYTATGNTAAEAIKDAVEQVINDPVTAEWLP